MSLDTDRLRHLARLARLALPEPQLAPLQHDLARIVTLVDALQAVDVEGVTPLAHPLALGLPLREDRVSDADRHADLVALAPAEAGGYYLVPKVLE